MSLARGVTVLLAFAAAAGGCGGCGPDACDPPTGRHEFFAHRTYASLYATIPACSPELSGEMDLRADGIARVRISQHALERECALTGVPTETKEGEPACAAQIECPPCEGETGCLGIGRFFPSLSGGPPELLTGTIMAGLSGSASCQGNYQFALWRVGDAP